MDKEIKKPKTIDEAESISVVSELEKLELTPEQIEAVQKIINVEVTREIAQSKEENQVTDDISVIEDAPADVVADTSKQGKSEADISYEAKLAELDAREKAINLKEKTTLVRDSLVKNNLPVELADFITIVDDADIESIIAELAKILSEYIGKQTLKDNYKPNNSSNKGTSITKEQFKKMGYTDREKLYKSNPELYKILSK